MLLGSMNPFICIDADEELAGLRRAGSRVDSERGGRVMGQVVHSEEADRSSRQEQLDSEEAEEADRSSWIAETGHAAQKGIRLLQERDGDSVLGRGGGFRCACRDGRATIECCKSRVEMEGRP